MSRNKRANDDKQYLAALRKNIDRLKKEKNAVVVAHNYERPEVQQIADICGDSLELSRAVMKIDADVVVFCGVHFMAETASILNPRKKILLPVKEAGCPMADMITLKKLRKLKKQYPGVPVVCYVNSSAAVKAESDVCCTSSNALEIVASLPGKKVIFIPDKNLGDYIQAKLPEKEIVLWEGFCPTHIRVSEDEIIDSRKKHPAAHFIAHPECPQRLLEHADYIGSTSGMLRYVAQAKNKEFIVGTEMGMIYRLQKENPSKRFYCPSEHFICADMKLTTLGWIAHSLETMTYEVKVSGSMREKAKRSLDAMLAVLPKEEKKR
ncbi:MAG: quinolinate synthase NadA [Candidatus Omnitrophica bacterium]|nr:quinolinate synthase NadA [Candidatus Omnitrophota bacterium]MBU4477979.1 quinolinate synthase NadA [Candidatus Omnitrophota bacterium]MCG2703385.1 quinolinate synthase NadA [Candidatus Omnitrophota bacterium]